MEKLCCFMISTSFTCLFLLLLRVECLASKALHHWNSLFANNMLVSWGFLKGFEVLWPFAVLNDFQGLVALYGRIINYSFSSWNSSLCSRWTRARRSESRNRFKLIRSAWKRLYCTQKLNGATNTMILVIWTRSKWLIVYQAQKLQNLRLTFNSQFGCFF